MSAPRTLRHKISQELHHTRGKFVATLAAAIYLGCLLLWQSNHITAIDPIPQLEQPTLQEQRLAAPVTVGLHVHSFPRFSFNQNDFVLDGVLWFKFISGTIPLQTLEAFSFHNAMQEPSGLVFKSAPIIKLMADQVLACYHVQVHVKAALNHKNFPLGSRRLTVMIQNKTITPREITFSTTPDLLTIAPDNLVQDWAPRTTMVKTGYVSAPLDPHNPTIGISYPAAVFSIEFENIGTRDLVSLYFPMFVLFLIALFCLLIEITDTARLGYVAAAVPILVLFRIVIDGVSPQVGYTTHLDFIYNLLVLLSLIILFFQGFVILTLQRSKDAPENEQAQTRRRLEYANTVVFFGTLLALITLVTCTFFR